MAGTAQEILVYNRNIVINIIALILIGSMAIWAATNKHRVREMRMFMRMCVLTAGISICDIVYYSEMKKLQTGDANAAIFWGWVLIDVFMFLMVGQWLLFVEYSLHQSNDVIKRDYKYIMIPFWVAVVFIAGSYLLYNDFVFDRIPPEHIEAYGLIGGYITRALSWIAKGIIVFYYIFAYYLVAKEKKRIKIPNYVVITPTVICFILGMFYNRDYLTRVQSIFFTVGLFLIWFFMFRRFAFMDPETGFFTEKYLKVLYDNYEKAGENGCSIISFTPKGDPLKMADVLKEWIPEDSKTVRLSNGKFLVVSEALNRSVAKRYMSLITEQAREDGIDVETDFATRADEPVQKFFEKMM
ncbi:MAG: hypothetical protein IIZ61_03765 [Lachnospiraceae bacterium]|nr:hypothetical protein [Lachnospiraceae bacterium]